MAPESAETAIAAAAHASLSKLISSRKAEFDAALADVLEHVEDRNAAFAGLRAEDALVADAADLPDLHDMGDVPGHVATRTRQERNDDPRGSAS